MDFEGFVLGLLEGAGNFDFNILIRALLWGLVVIWVFTVFWVFLDAKERSESKWFWFASVFLVTFMNVVGLVIYMLIRPKNSIDELYWSELERRYLLYETSELGDCPECGYFLKPGFNVCPNCSFVLKIQCDCGVMVENDWSFCAYCGKDYQDRHELEDVVVAHSIKTADIAKRAMRNHSPKQPDLPAKKANELKRSKVVETSDVNVVKKSKDSTLVSNTPKKNVIDDLGRSVLGGVLAFGKAIDNIFRGVFAPQENLAKSGAVVSDEPVVADKQVSDNEDTSKQEEITPATEEKTDSTSDDSEDVTQLNNAKANKSKKNRKKRKRRK